MRDSEDLAEHVAHAIAASSTTSRTPPGPTEGPTEGSTDGASPARNDPALIEAINQVFALFRLNFNNQYYAAFRDEEQLRQIKKLWLDSLREFPPAQILQGAKLAIEGSEYLPTLHRMRSCCEDSLPALGLPASREAYLQACSAGAPAEAQHWAHAAVYWAGRDCGWSFLASTNEAQGWPVFQRRYQARCAMVLSGNTLPPVPEPPADRLAVTPLQGDAALAQIQRLREDNAL